MLCDCSAPYHRYMTPLFSIFVGGILPFGAVFIELFFILSSIWLHQVQSHIISKSSSHDLHVISAYCRPVVRTPVQSSQCFHCIAFIGIAFIGIALLSLWPPPTPTSSTSSATAPPNIPLRLTMSRMPWKCKGKTGVALAHCSLLTALAHCSITTCLAFCFSCSSS